MYSGQRRRCGRGGGDAHALLFDGVVKVRDTGGDGRPSPVTPSLTWESYTYSLYCILSECRPILDVLRMESIVAMS